jgi:hypothetical protein
MRKVRAEIMATLRTLPASTITTFTGGQRKYFEQEGFRALFRES